MPRQVGKWELISTIGEGQWSEVYRARPVGLAEDFPADYAIKLARPDVDQEVARTLLQREACVARLTMHPNLTTVLSSRLDQSPLFLVMPYLPGASLRKILGRYATIGISHALWIARQVAQALDALHDVQWIHADVKPGNILVTPRGHVTLIDCGMAQDATCPSDLDRTTITGTIAYMAPERISTLGQVEPRSDIYSLGVTLFETLTGQMPYEGDDAHSLALAHLHHLPRDPRHLDEQLPPSVAQLLIQMLAKDPQRRPSAAVLISRLIALEVETLHNCVAA